MTPEFVWLRHDEPAVTLEPQTVLRVDHLEGVESDDGDHGVVVHAVVEDGAMAGTRVVLGQALRHGKQIVIEPALAPAGDSPRREISLRPIDADDRKFF